MGTSDNRRRISWLLLQAAVACLALALLAIVYPHEWPLGSFAISLRSVRGPLIGFGLAMVAWRWTVDPASEPCGSGALALRFCDGCLALNREWYARIRDAWRGWNWPSRALFVAASVNLVLVVLHTHRFSKILEIDRENRENAFNKEEWQFGGRKFPSLEYFAQQVVRQTPANARILFEGRTAGLRFAYEVYPRRVFMLPQDYRQMAAERHAMPWLPTPPEDKHMGYWHQFLPRDVVNANEFVRQHQITYVASFDELNLSRCSLERVR